ncbi:MAG: glycosyltransferase family 4 protein [Thermoplasmata archaeon]
MNILRINSWDGGNTGGAEVSIRREVQALEALGHRNRSVAIVTEEPPVNIGVDETFIVRANSSRARGLGEWLERVARDAAPDVIHLHHFRSGFRPLAKWLRSRREPIVLTAHDVDLICPVSTLTLPDGSHCRGEILPRCQFTGCPVGWGLPYKISQKRAFEANVRRRVRKLICVSEATRRAFKDLGYEDTTIIRPVIPKRDLVEIPKGRFVIGFLGRFDAQKGIGTLLDAFKLAGIPDSGLLLVGRGPYVVPPGPAIRVEPWTGDVAQFFRRVHVLVCPSTGWENLGNSPLEATSFGVPAIVSDSGGLPETVGSGEWGRVFHRGDARALASELAWVYGNYAAAKRAATIGSYLLVNEYSEDVHMRKLLGVYREALAC